MKPTRKLNGAPQSSRERGIALAPQRPSDAVASPGPSVSRASTPSTPASQPHAIRVLCVDDHAVLVDGLKAQFAIDGRIEVVGRLPSAAGLVEEVRRLRADAVLLDIEMPGPDAFESADRLRRACPDVRLIVLSAHIRDGFISASFAAGACAYFAKSDEPSDIVSGVYQVMHRRSEAFLLGPKVRERCQVRQSNSAAVPSGTAQGGSPPLLAGAPTSLLQSLSSREAEILRLIGKGLSRHRIAAELCRSVKTIDGHQDRILRKLGISTRADLTRFAIREGLAQA